MEVGRVAMKHGKRGAGDQAAALLLLGHVLVLDPLVAVRGDLQSELFELAERLDRLVALVDGLLAFRLGQPEAVARELFRALRWADERGVQVSTRQLDALQVQISACTTRGHQIDIKVGDGFVRRSGATLDWYNF